MDLTALVRGNRMKLSLGLGAVTTATTAALAAQAHRSPFRRALGWMAALQGAAVALGGWARVIEPRWVEIVRTRLTWRGPPLRIVFLTDLHARDGDAKRLERVVDRAMALAPDLVLLGGDYVGGLDAAPAKLDALTPLAALRAPHGVYGVLGNHDSEPAGSPAPRSAAIRDCLERAGACILENERVHLPGMALVALGSWRAGRSDPQSAFDGLAPHHPTLVLTHNWQSLRLPGVGRFDVALAGHTHGGQACIPILGLCPFLEPDMRPYFAGLYDWPTGGKLYVSRGLGTSEVRVRFAARPEITLLELERPHVRARRHGRDGPPRLREAGGPSTPSLDDDRARRPARAPASSTPPRAPFAGAYGDLR